MRFVLIAAGLLVVAATVGYLLRDDAPADMPASLENAAVTLAENVPPVAQAVDVVASSDPETPCPYCDQNNERWRESTDAPPPELLGAAGVLMEGSCGDVLFGANAHDRRAPASLTKIVTAMSVVEHARLNDRVNITITGWDMSVENDSSIMGLIQGMELSVEELLYGLLLSSGNDAALQLSEYMGGEAHLVEMMNQRVRELGLRDTRLGNSHGLDTDGAYSTPFDMAVLGRELLSDSLLKEIVATEFLPADWHDIGGLWNANYLIYIYEDAIGIKTGFTEEAGSNIVAAAERDGRVLIASVFDSADVYWDSMRLFDWAYEHIPSVC